MSVLVDWLKGSGQNGYREETNVKRLNWHLRRVMEHGGTAFWLRGKEKRS
jgi:hypothetical protein